MSLQCVLERVFIYLRFSEHTGYGEHEGQAALRGQPSRQLQKTSNRPVSFALVRLERSDTRSLLISPLNSAIRAVEYFIRDKYEKKKYYNKNAINGSSVRIDPYLNPRIKPTRVFSLFLSVPSAKRH